MINLISSAVAGLFIGALARFFYPGAVHMGLLWTIVLGIAGSLLAGAVTSRGGNAFNRAGLIASVLGAMALIFLGRHVGW
jgi:uncharacterized membrane protein YeaQ/YmgE (transglycosylase-associated protein family)